MTNNIDTCEFCIGRIGNNIIFRGKGFQKAINGEPNGFKFCLLADGIDFIVSKNRKTLLGFEFPIDQLEQEADIFTDSGKIIPQQEFVGKTRRVWETLPNGGYCVFKSMKNITEDIPTGTVIINLKPYLISRSLNQPITFVSEME